MFEDMEDVEVQPTGASVERTLDVVGYILSDLEFAEKVAAHNNWSVDDLDQKDVALLFLASRYQWSMELLTLRTNTLLREVDGLARQLADIEGRIGG